jgi:hypothetical protein
MGFTDFERHVLERLTEVEEGLRELRGVSWPVCQGLNEKDSGPFQDMKNKRRFFQFLDVDEIRTLLRSKARFLGMSQDVVVEELRQVLVEVPREGGV